MLIILTLVPIYISGQPIFKLHYSIIQEVALKIQFLRLVHSFCDHSELVFYFCLNI